MLNWSSSPPQKFEERLASKYVSISEGARRAVHTNGDDMHGVLFLDQPLRTVDGMRYFEVCLEAVNLQEQDGLTMGVTAKLPSQERYGCAADVPYSWSVGYDGRANIHGASDLVLTNWNPICLNVGDRVGFLVAGDGAACVVVNNKRVANLPGTIPIDLPLYGMVDLLGHAQGISLVDVMFPPQSNFCLQIVRDEALDAMYAGLRSGSKERAKAGVLTARLVGIDDAVIRGAERVVRAMPVFPAQAPGGPVTSAGKSRKTIAPRSTPRGYPLEGRDVVPKSPPKANCPRGADEILGRSPNHLKDAQATQELKPILESDAEKLSEETTKVEAIGSSRGKKEKSEVQRKTELLQRQSEAVQAMTEAWRSGSLNSFKSAVSRAEASEVDAAVLAQANERMRELELRGQAETGLVDAIALGGINNLRSAISEAERVHVTCAALLKARSLLQSLELECKQEAEKALADAFESEELDNCITALGQAKAANVNPATIAKYQQRFGELQLKTDASKTLMESMTSRDIGSLKLALKHAKTVDLETAIALEAECLLHSLELEQSHEAEKHLADALAAEDTTELRKALSQAATSNVELSLIAKAREKLHELERKLEIEKALTDALLKNDHNSLKFALQLAKPFCVEPTIISKAEARLIELQRKAEAQKALADSLHIVEPEKLKEIISRAVLVQADSGLIAQAQTRLKQLELQREKAQKRLQEIMDSSRMVSPPTVEAIYLLEVGIEEALAEGVAQEGITEAKNLLEQMGNEQQKARQASAELLVEAVASKDTKNIRSCLETCKIYGADQAIAEALSAVACRLNVEMEIARGMEREDRGDRLPGMEQLLSILREHCYPELRKLHNDFQDLKGALRVFCRIRPLSAREIHMHDPVAVQMTNQFTVSVTLPKRNAAEASEKFSYDAVFAESHNTQTQIFSECRSLIQSAFDGYNITIFTYGQTGAGKTWTLYGDADEPGISPRTCDEVFSLIDRDRDKFDFVVSASMVELYNNNIRDLLSTQKVPPKIDIRIMADSVRLDCTEIEVSSAADLNKVVDHGFGQRKVASTIVNADSSRSHLFFTIRLAMTDKASGRTRTGKITIVDLAGSERISKTQVTGEIQKEAIEINKSLTALCDVMSAITAGARVVPYRNHKLTMLMQDSLGGTAKTLMFVNISPTNFNADESFNTLKYASRARSIENDVVKCDQIYSPSRRSMTARRSFGMVSPRFHSPSVSPRSAVSPRGSSPRMSFPGHRGSSPRGSHLTSSPRLSSMAMLSRSMSAR